MPDSTTPPSTDPQTLCYSSTAGCKRPGHGPYHWCDHPKGHDGPTGAAVEWSSCYPPRREAPDLSRGMKRVLRSREDSERQLQEQVGFLRTSSRLYDEGEQAEAKRLAGALRILLYDQGSCHSLLGQLGMLGEPRVLTGPAMLTGGEMPFAVWWEQDAFWLTPSERRSLARMLSASSRTRMAARTSMQPWMRFTPCVVAWPGAWMDRLGPARGAADGRPHGAVLEADCPRGSQHPRPPPGRCPPLPVRRRGIRGMRVTVEQSRFPLDLPLVPAVVPNLPINPGAHWRTNPLTP